MAELPDRPHAATIHRREQKQLGEKEQRAPQHATGLAEIFDEARRDLHEVPGDVVDQLALVEVALFDQNVAFLFEKLVGWVAGDEDRVMVRLQHERQNELEEIGEGGLLAVVCTMSLHTSKRAYPSCSEGDTPASRSKSALIGDNNAARSAPA